LNEMFSKENIFKEHRFKCDCGKEHILPIKEIIIGPGAIDNLKQIDFKLSLKKNGLVIIDKLIYEIIGQKIMNSLKGSGFDIKLSLFPSNSIAADESAIVKVLNDLEDNTDFLVAVGSGTINDLVRYVSFKTRRPYISIPTSPSMDGYTATVSLLINNGFKRTFKASYPLAIYADTTILRNAPAIFTAAGFGDLLAKTTARADWLISSVISGEYYCDFTAQTIQEVLDKCIKNLDKIAARDEQGLILLTRGLMISGIAMHWVNSSRPAAGAEHHISHFWEMKAMQDKKPEHLHGLKVALGTLIMSRVYEKLFSIDLKRFNLKESGRKIISRDKWEYDIRRVFGPVAEEVIIENKEKSFSEEDWSLKFQSIVKKSDEWKKGIKAFLPQSRDIKKWLSVIGGLLTLEDLGLGREDLKESIIYSKELRSKFTGLEVADYLGVLEQIAEEISKEISTGIL